MGVRNSPERIFLSDLKKKILSDLASFRSYPQRLSERGFEIYLYSEVSHLGAIFAFTSFYEVAG